MSRELVSHLRKGGCIAIQCGKVNWIVATNASAFQPKDLDLCEIWINNGDLLFAHIDYLNDGAWQLIDLAEPSIVMEFSRWKSLNWYQNNDTLRVRIAPEPVAELIKYARQPLIALRASMSDGRHKEVNLPLVKANQIPLVDGPTRMLFKPDGSFELKK